MAGAAHRPGRWRGGRLGARPPARRLRRRRPSGAGAGAGALEALALPLAEAPEVALDLLRVDLAAGQVHVRLGDQALLVALERHPLGEHVVGVGQPRRAVGPRLVRELDAVLVQQPAGLRQVGDDRLVRVDQVGVRRAAQVARAPGSPAAPARRPTRGGSRGRGTSPTPPRSRTTQELAGALLGAALAAGVVAGQPSPSARRPRGRGGASSLRSSHGSATSQSSASTTIAVAHERDGHSRRPALRRYARRRRRAGRR